MASEEVGFVPPQRLENGLNSQLVFQDEALRFNCGAPQRRVGDPGPKTRELSSFIDEKMFCVERDRYFHPQGGEFRRSIYGDAPPERPDGRNWNGNGNTPTPSGEGSEGEEDDDEEEEDDDDEVDEGDGEVEGLVAVDDANKSNNHSSGSLHSSADKIGNGKAKDHSSFGSNRDVLMKDGAIVLSTNSARASPIFAGPGGSAPGQKELAVENGCGFSGRKDVSLSTESGESLKAILSDPLTGALMDDAMILPCGHSFGGGGMQHVIKMCKVCGVPSCSDLETDERENVSVIANWTVLFTLHVRRSSLRKMKCGPVLNAIGKSLLFICAECVYLDSSQKQCATCMKISKACSTCSQPFSEDSVQPNLSLRAAVQAFRREEELQVYRTSKRRRERSDQDKCSYGDSTLMDTPRGRGVQFPFAVTDRVIIKGNKRTPQRFVGREAVVTTQCLNGWYVVKTLDNAESVKLQYRSLAKVPDNPSSKPMLSKMTPNWL
ncbi:U-box domain-containing protein 62 [Vitis vinifera]|uniref:U-box domain-containing protein 62 n=1 Tax=Vitis vinifera TaxID=29760 RepID=A0A438E3Z9_VITVI|nr:U-box domain-containing protein 62 [Vitis vinifera]